MNGAVDYLVEKGISIHSAARAETIPWRKSIMSIRISIHSAARAETLYSYACPSATSISIHSAARAETQ